MRHLFTFALSFLLVMSGLSQTTITEQYPKTLWSAKDSFTVSFSNSKSFVPSFQIGKRDTFDIGNDAVVGIYAIVNFGNDSLRIDYRNLPFAQIHFIRFQSPKGSCVLKLHFNQVMAAFPQQYIDANSGQVQFQIPEVFELANVLWILSPSGQKTVNLNKHDAYYNRVLKYFKPYRNHPIFRQLSFDDSSALNHYYDFRDNSFAYSFENNQIVYKGPYYYITGNDKDFNSLFKQLLPLATDFSIKSNFRKFYQQNEAYYNQLINQQRKLMRISTMWTWLEKQFPDKYKAYKIAFSPLITISHSTQNFYSFVNGWFSETVMFVSGPNFYDTARNTSQNFREGIASGIVFTEIDHNYINPISAKYRKLIDSIFSDRTVWTSSDRNAKFYSSPESVFNEYMTHAVFCLYALDTYDSKAAQAIIEKREDLMINRRGYPKFREFNKTLVELYQRNKETKVADLYPSLLEWCKTQL
jgi:hypothetical protein